MTPLSGSDEMTGYQNQALKDNREQDMIGGILLRDKGRGRPGRAPYVPKGET